MLETPDLYLKEYEIWKINVFAKLEKEKVTCFFAQDDIFYLDYPMNHEKAKDFFTEENALGFLKIIPQEVADYLASSGTVIFYAEKITKGRNTTGFYKKRVILGKRTFKVESIEDKLKEAPEIN